MSTLFTEYAKSIENTVPHSYYPRPSLKRDSFIYLNGEWEYGESDICEEYIYTEKILVPFAPESALSGIGRTPREYMHYRRTFVLDDTFKDLRVLLHFGAVDQECTVVINGKQKFEHKGGYLPFEFDITDAAVIGQNAIEVHACDLLDKKYPYGKQTKKRGGMWYTPVSGIWQSVWLEIVPENYIQKLKIDTECGRVMLTVTGGYEEKTVTLDTGECFYFTGDSCDITPKDARVWSPESPNLYTFTLKSGEDFVESYFAIREIGVTEEGGLKRITLNGKPYIFNGLLDQGYYPDGIFTPATVDAYLDDIRLAKSLGFNMLRKHIKLEPEIFYYLCDKEGIAVFQDMVNNGSYSFLRDTALPTIGLQRLPDRFLHTEKESRRIFEESMLQTADYLYNHPSVVYYTIFNEGWGQFCADKMYKRLKDKDGTRIIDATSGWFRRKESDVDSRHVYFKRLKVFKADKRPVVISEFGGYSYRVEGHLFSEKNYGYRLCGSREEYEKELYELYLSEVLPLVKAGASAFVYTQLSDVEDETNGLITYDRRVIKVTPERCREVMEKITRA